MRTLLMAACVTLTLASQAHAQTGERSGEQIVKAQCVKCHETGVSGAPKIDDRAAWSQRMKNGLDATVRSAMRGHGKMPARGGMAELSDTELRAAILYMFYPAAAAARPAAAAPAKAAPDPRHKAVEGIDIYLGIKPLDAKGNYHVNISLREGAADVKDAQVEARVANPLGGASKKLNARTIDGTLSYGNDFQMTGREPYTIAVTIRRPGSPAPLEARFDFKP